MNLQHLALLQDEVKNDRDPFLTSLGERVRGLRVIRGQTRKTAALSAGVSERHWANLEYGTGNVSVLVLQQVAQALQCSQAELLGDVSASSPEWLLLRELLSQCDEASLRRVRLTAIDLLGKSMAAEVSQAPGERSARIALLGLRGAGKSTLGKILADDLGVPFVEISRDVEALAGCSVSEIQALYGASAYRRYERRALEACIQHHSQVVIATPGGLVSDAASFGIMLSNCTTVWLQAEPEDHMKRVAAQGDMRPMAASREAMQDLKNILKGRSAFYSKAEFSLNTSRQNLTQTVADLRLLVRTALGLAA
jgi:XRE family transcriptional regulator, aerobic/anaerobic benzoate catabolism transcriptional regulator